MLMRLGREKGMVLAAWKKYILCFYHKNFSNKSNFLIGMLSNCSLVLAKSKWLARPR